MELNTIKKLMSVAKTHRDGKWFIPSVAALLEIDGADSYPSSDSEDFINVIDEQLLTRFLGVFESIEDWIDFYVLKPLGKNITTPHLLDCVDKTRLANKYLEDKKIAFKSINNYIYVFKL